MKMLVLLHSVEDIEDFFSEAFNLKAKKIWGVLEVKEISIKVYLERKNIDRTLKIYGHRK